VLTFAGKRALITGAGSGIGAAVARLLAAEGAEVIVADLSPEAVADELGAQAIVLDVRHEAEVELAMADLDVLVNCAGIGSTTNAPETTLDVWENVFAVNARGTFLCCKHAIPGMTARGGGSIVNVASVAGLIGLRNRAAYSASKGAVISLTRALAVDHVDDGIRVNAVAPGTVDSPWVRRLVAVQNRHFRAFLGHRLGGGGADPRAAAGDECALPGETGHCAHGRSTAPSEAEPTSAR